VSVNSTGRGRWGQRIDRARRILRVLPAAIYKGGGLRGMLGRMWLIYRQSGLQGVKTSLAILLRGEGPPRMASAGTLQRKNYAEWLRLYEPKAGSQRAAMEARMRRMAHPPLISVLMPVYAPDVQMLAQAIASVRAQTYPHWELCIADDASPATEVRALLEEQVAQDPRIRAAFRPVNGNISAASNSALELVNGEWVALMDHDDLLREDALFWVAAEIDAHPDAQLIYSDEDKIDGAGVRSAPNFKPDWNPELLCSQNYTSHLGVYRSDLVRAVGGFREGLEGAQDHDLTLRCVERLGPEQIRHIPRVLYHWRVHAASTAATLDAKPYAIRAGERAIREHLARTGVAASVEGSVQGYHVRYAVPQPPPLVSIVIPTRNAHELVAQCIGSIRSRTTYPNYEILLVDNGSDEAASLDAFAALETQGVRVLRDAREFNYSQLNNGAVAQARGELVALINNDIEVISPDWLDEMVGLACQTGVGCVGARLWFPDKTLQHGGVIIGLGGVAGHSHKHLRAGDGGFFQRAVLTQNLSAVTAACLVVRKAVYERVGGLDETHLRVAFNDIDFCLRVREAGYRNVWTPYAELFHHESATRGTDIAPAKQARYQSEVRYMQSRWSKELKHDPAYSPNLTLDHEDFSYAWPPRVSPMP